MNETDRSGHRIAGGLLLGLLVVAVGVAAWMGSGATAVAAETSAPAANGPLCRTGVNVVGEAGSIEAYDIAPLRIGWYIDYFAFPEPPRPNGVEYVPVVTLKQVGDNDYGVSPKKSTLRLVAQLQPGAMWMIGNEPDRREVQNDLEPHIYAMAYHDMYALIKNEDPTARVVAGTIVQPTELRLRYLDLVLEAYLEMYGEPMPVDGWSIHNFILNEVSCDYDPGNCWGAGIPPGMDDPYGEILSPDDNDNIDMFKERIRRFRQWMADQGYRGYPLYLTEYGVLMPDWLGFDMPRVNTFMDKTFEYMLTETDPALGDPRDDYRLIQRWSWYSTADPNFNGWLFDDETNLISPMGQNFADLTAVIPDIEELTVSAIQTAPATLFSPDGQPVDVTLRAVVANAGHLLEPTTVKVRFYDGDPTQGGTKIGSDRTVAVSGCGDTAVAEVTWSDVPAGSHRVYVVVDPQDGVDEPDEGNNTTSRTIVVATEQLYLPNVAR